MVTKDQALTANYFHDESHNVWRRNGQTKVWKRSPEKFRVPVKFGMYRYNYVDNVNAYRVHIPTDDCPVRRY